MPGVLEEQAAQHLGRDLQAHLAQAALPTPLSQQGPLRTTVLRLQLLQVQVVHLPQTVLIHPQDRPSRQSVLPLKIASLRRQNVNAHSQCPFLR